jgi:predicted RecA/RadA family phage recombinase
MDIVAQIVTETVGEPKRKEFQVSELDQALSSDGERKHVTLYPADYKTEWEGEGYVDVPKEVTVTIMPGAVVGYKEDFYFENFQVDDGEGGTETYQGPPLAPTDPSGSSNHPLNYQPGDDPATYAERYNAPEFSGAVENITDLNLGSEWPLRQEFERSIWSVKARETGEQSEQRDKVSFDVPFKGTVEYEGGNKVYIENEELEGEDDGAKVTINHIEYDDNENTPKEDDPFSNNQTSLAIQTLNIDDGHVLDAETFKVVERVGADDNYLTFTGNKGKLLIGHAATGFLDQNDDPTDAPQVPTDQPTVDSNQNSVSLRAFETDDRGHIRNIEYGPSVQEVRAGRAIKIGNNNSGVPEVGVDAGGLQGGKNININDANPIDFTLADATYREALSSDPEDPDPGDSVIWLSDGTESGDDGDVLLKITDTGGTTKTTTLADFSSL